MTRWSRGIVVGAMTGIIGFAGIGASASASKPHHANKAPKACLAAIRDYETLSTYTSKVIGEAVKASTLISTAYDAGATGSPTVTTVETKVLTITATVHAWSAKITKLGPKLHAAVKKCEG